MNSLIEDIFGVYTPITYEVLLDNGDTYNAIPAGMAGVDWTFIAGVAIFCIAFYSFFRVLGGVICRE